MSQAGARALLALKGRVAASAGDMDLDITCAGGWPKQQQWRQLHHQQQRRQPAPAGTYDEVGSGRMHAAAAPLFAVPADCIPMVYTGERFGMDCRQTSSFDVLEGGYGGQSQCQLTVPAVLN